MINMIKRDLCYDHIEGDDSDVDKSQNWEERSSLGGTDKWNISDNHAVGSVLYGMSQMMSAFCRTELGLSGIFVDHPILLTNNIFSLLFYYINVK